MILIVEGKAGFGATPVEYIADMLRYDGGEVLFMFEESTTDFLAVIQCDYYTKDRWLSFGLTTRESFHNFPLILPVYEPDEDCRDCVYDCCGTHNLDCYFGGE